MENEVSLRVEFETDAATLRRKVGQWLRLRGKSWVCLSETWRD